MSDPNHVGEMTDLPLKDVESLVGYLARVGEARGWGSPYHVAEIAGLKKLDAIWCPSDEDVEALSELCDLPVRPLEDIAWSMPGSSVSVTDLTRTHARVCPLCLQERTALRREWELLAVTECSLHGVQLVDMCPCGASISVRRPAVDFCNKCGGPVSTAEAVASDPTVAALNTSLVQLAVAERWRTVSSTKDLIIENIGYGALVELCTYLSGLVLWKGDRSDHRNRIDVGSWRRTLEDAAPFLVKGWPSGFVELIRRVERVDDGETGRTISSAFPHLYRSLYAGGDAPWRNQLRSVFDAYVLAERPELLQGLPTKHVISKRLELHKSYLTLRAAAVEVGTTWSAVARAIEELGIKPAVLKRAKDRTTQRISRDQLQKVEAEVRRRPEVYLAKGPAAQRLGQGARRRFQLEVGVDVDRAYGWFHDGRSFPSDKVLEHWPSQSLIGIVNIAQRLGVSPATATKLRDDGWFAPKGSARRPMHAVFMEDYAGFEEQVLALVGAKRTDVKGGRPLLDALDGILKRHKVDLCHLLSLIVKGEVALVGVDGKGRGLNRLLLSARDLTAVIRRMREEQASGGLRISEVTSKLGLSDTNIVSRLGQAGFLKSRSVGTGPTARKEYLPSDVAAFQESFIGLKEINRRRLFGRLSAPAASRSYLARRGIKPVCGPDINGVPAVFFERAAVEEVSWFTRDREK